MELEPWIIAHTARSVAAVELAISATHLVRQRAEFGQLIVPSKGSVLASIAIGDWNPEPDYFFHWVRDSAIVMRTVAELFETAATDADRQRWQMHFEDFVRFSLKLTGAKQRPAYDLDYVGKTRSDFRKYLRSEQELRSLGSDELLGEPRFNPDGTLDVLQWARPQYDGPALRALACLRFIAAGALITAELQQLLHIDLDFTRRHAGRPCIGPWEEESARHYHVTLVQLGALVQSLKLTGGDAAIVERGLYDRLDEHWFEQHRSFAAAMPVKQQATADDGLDASFLLGILDADLPDGPHSVDDPRVHATQQAIETLFERTFEINRTLFRGRAPAIGRYKGEKYFGGGAWLPTTLAAATLYYHRARRNPKDRNELVKKGDEFLRTVRDLIPADGSMPEQVDSSTGKPVSAPHLTWSYAAFVSAALAREKVCAIGLFVPPQ